MQCQFFFLKLYFILEKNSLFYDSTVETWIHYVYTTSGETICIKFEFMA